MILDGRKVANLRNKNLKNKIIEEGLTLKTAIILVGEDPASLIYVNSKIRASKRVGIESKLIHLKENTTDLELTKIITDLNKNENIDGILLQLPLPSHLDSKKFINLIDPKKDIDGFTTVNQGKLFQDLPTIRPATPQGILNLLDHYNIDVAGMDVCVIGRSQIVGLPTAKMLSDRNATVSILHKQTKDLKKYTKIADLIVVATGNINLLTEDMVKDGVIVVDVGINRLNGKIYGDVDFLNVSKKAKYISPVPKGVGPMTINALLENVFKIKRGENL